MNTPQRGLKDRAMSTASPGYSSSTVNVHAMMRSTSSAATPEASRARRAAAVPRTPAVSPSAEKRRVRMWVTRSTHFAKSPEEGS